jgi:hypothetical protein
VERKIKRMLSEHTALISCVKSKHVIHTELGQHQVEELWVSCCYMDSIFIFIFVRNTHSAILLLMVKRLLYKNMEISARNVRVQFEDNRVLSWLG